MGNLLRALSRYPVGLRQQEYVEPRQSGIVDVFDIDFCRRFRERFDYALPVNRLVLKNRFETLPVEVMHEFTAELVQSVEVGSKGEGFLRTTAEYSEDTAGR